METRKYTRSLTFFVRSLTFFFFKTNFLQSRLEGMEMEYFEKKEQYEDAALKLMRAKEELAFINANRCFWRTHSTCREHIFTRREHIATPCSR